MGKRVGEGRNEEGRRWGGEGREDSFLFLLQVRPDDGFVWASGWRICFELSARPDGRGYQYAAGIEGRWSGELRKEAVFRRRWWRRSVIPMERIPFPTLSPAGEDSEGASFSTISSDTVAVEGGGAAGPGGEARVASQLVGLAGTLMLLHTREEGGGVSSSSLLGLTFTLSLSISDEQSSHTSSSCLLTV